MGSRKIKRRTRGKDRIVKMTPEAADAVQRQVDKFRAKFGGEPGKVDPLPTDSLEPDSSPPAPNDEP